jgi:hypothetical protein
LRLDHAALLTQEGVPLPEKGSANLDSCAAEEGLRDLAIRSHAHTARSNVARSQPASVAA